MKNLQQLSNKSQYFRQQTVIEDEKTAEFYNLQEISQVRQVLIVYLIILH